MNLKKQTIFRYLFPTCGWIFSSSQEAGSRTASLKRSNQVKGLRHSRSVSCLFSETLQYPWVNSAIAISWHGCFYLFSFALMQNISTSMEWIKWQQTSSWHFDFFIAVFSTSKRCSCSILHCKIGVSDMNAFLFQRSSWMHAVCVSLLIGIIMESHISRSKWHCACQGAVKQCDIQCVVTAEVPHLAYSLH